jgi:alkylation response protein AidB-like acyl-CoA dehydrogenase
MPWSLIRRIEELGIVGKGIDGYGCPGFDPIAYGLVHLELNRGDGSLDTFVGVHAGLAIKSIAMLGSEEQRQDWLPRMARLEKLGAFALTDPNHGSDSVALETTARRDGGQSVISGAKRLGVEPGRALTGSVSAVSSIALTGGFPWPCWTISASMARWPSSLARRPVWGSRSPWHWRRPVPTSRSVHAGSTA